jgi:cyanophycinase-like exopeptidase
MENKEIIIKKKIKTEIFEGEIEVAALTYTERIAQSKASTVATVALEDGSNEHKVISENLDRAQVYYELAVKQVRLVDVKIVSNDSDSSASEVIDSVDGLMVYQEGQEIVMDIATGLIAGITLGKRKSLELSKIVNE